MKCGACGYHVTTVAATSCKLCGFPLDGPPAAARATAAPPRQKQAARRAEWYRHVLVRAGAAPVELKLNQRLTIGRASEAGLVVPSPRVSRQHAEVVWREGAPVLRDLGSQNGTSVNGARVTEHALADQDEVLIGPHEYTYRRLSGAGDPKKVQGLLDTALQTKPMLSDTLAGPLAQTSLFEVLQMLEVGAKTGEVTVLSDDRTGRVVLDEGRLVHASLDDLGGVPALHAMCAWTGGMFRFTTAVEGDPPQNLPGTLTILMIEAARQLPDGPTEGTGWL